MPTNLTITVAPGLASLLFWGVLITLLTLAILSAVRWVVDQRTRDLRQRVATLDQRVDDLEARRDEE